MIEEERKICAACKKSYNVSDFTSRTNKILKTCIKSRTLKIESVERTKCEYGKRKCRCKECGGASICGNNRQRHICKECGVASICEHGRERNVCKECNGASICEHDKRHSRCPMCDKQGYISDIVRSRVNIALKTKKELPSKKYVGCGIHELVEHIEKQFKPNMSWENYGTLWHIDHKIPLKYENPSLNKKASLY